ncbi:MAG: PQQ-dependent sugar dehydrogenase [Patescibacteria group bacterium]
MNRKVLWWFLIFLIAGLIWLLFGLWSMIYAPTMLEDEVESEEDQITELLPEEENNEENSPDLESITPQIEIVAENLEIPWEIKFLPNGEMLVTERRGSLKLISTDGSITSIEGLPQIEAIGEGGLLGMALSPNFIEDNLLYLYFTYRHDGQIYNRVSAFEFDQTENRLEKEKIIINNIAGGLTHNGGRLAFGPDGFLWLTTGDAGQPNLAQDIQATAGKILKIKADGSIPEDNPWTGLPVYSAGHRNPQGLAWQPETGSLFITEHGSQAHDEINKIISGGNYGWPMVTRCLSEDKRLTNPVWCSQTETWAPAGIVFYPQLDNEKGKALIYTGLRGQALYILWLDEEDRVVDNLKLLEGEFGRLRAITVGPDGYLYVSTSNRDGRGQIREGDDKIIKLIFD